MQQLKFLWGKMKGYRLRYAIGLLGSLIFSVLALSTATLTQRIVDEVIMQIPNTTGPLTELIRHLWMLIGLLVGATVLRTGLNYGNFLLFQTVGLGVNDRMRREMYRHISRQDKEFFDKNRTGDIMSRMTSDLDLVRFIITFTARSSFEGIFMFIFVLIYMFSNSWFLTVCLLAVTPLLFICSKKFSKKVRPQYQEMRDRQAELNTTAQENISGNRVVKAFAKESFEKEKFDVKNTEYKDQSIKANFTWLRFFPFMHMISQSLSVIVLLVGGILWIRGDITAGVYTAFNSMTWMLANPMQQLGNTLNEISRFSASMGKIMEIYDTQPKIVDKENAIVPTERIKGDIVFDDVSLELQGNRVLDHVSFHIKPGQTVAIMGPTGSGKTMLVNVLARLYETTEGSVKVDNIDVNDYHLQSLRGSIGMTTQEVFLFSDTLDTNIAYGKSDMPDEQMQLYAQLACVDFVDRLDNGYDTLIGERGTGLSGGQKQRIALARAMAIEPSILVLDDTTSAVDLETEAKIQEGLRSIRFECTKIIIAQRISSTRDADLIIVMKDGSIEEMGTSDELLANKGYFYDVYKLQYGDPEEIKKGVIG